MILIDYIEEYYGVAIVDFETYNDSATAVSEKRQRYKDDFDAIDGEIRRISGVVGKINEAKEREFLDLFPGMSVETVVGYNEQLKVRLSKPNTQRIYALAQALGNLSYLSKSAQAYLLTRIPFINEFYGKRGIPLTLDEIEAASSTLGQINGQEGWNTLFKKRMREFLDCALIDCSNYESGIRLETGTRYMRWVRDFEYPVFATVATMKKLQFTTDEKDFQEDFDEIRKWLSWPGLSKDQKLRMNIFPVFLLSLMKDGEEVEFPVTKPLFREEFFPRLDTFSTK